MTKKSHLSTEEKKIFASRIREVKRAHESTLMVYGHDETLSKQITKSIEKCNQALRRIKKNTYGICLETGKEIKRSELEVNPLQDKIFIRTIKLNREVPVSAGIPVA